MNKVRLYVFDLGKVLIDFDFNLAFRSWSQSSGCALDRIIGLFKADALYEKHETGAVDINVYHRHVIKMLDINLGIEDFIAGWNAIFMEEINGSRELVRQLGTHAPVVLLSNTNATHVSFLRRRYGELLSSFDRLYFSNEIGARKPQAAAFRRVLDDYELSGSEVVFFDDLPDNLRGAETLGIRTVHIDKPDQMQALLVDYKSLIG